MISSRDKMTPLSPASKEAFLLFYWRSPKMAYATTILRSLLFFIVLSSHTATAFANLGDELGSEAVNSLLAALQEMGINATTVAAFADGFSIELVETDVPSDMPSDVPSDVPSVVPTFSPTKAPTEVPTEAPTEAPSEAPTEAPTETKFLFELGNWP